MIILITNDDGIQSPGLTELAQELAREHTVYVVAPDSDRSGFSHSISIGRELHVRAVEKNRWMVDGTPADCVRIALNTQLVPQPDLIVSGINTGSNLGTDIIYSGTAAGARQAAMAGIPAVALSAFNYSSPADALSCARFISPWLESLRDTMVNHDRVYANINIPPKPDGRLIVTRPGVMRYQSLANTTPLPDGSHRVQLRAKLLPLDTTDSPDRQVVEDGAASVSAMGLWGIAEAYEKDLIHFCNLMQKQKNFD